MIFLFICLSHELFEENMQENCFFSRKYVYKQLQSNVLNKSFNKAPTPIPIFINSLCSEKYFKYNENGNCDSNIQNIFPIKNETEKFASKYTPENNFNFMFKGEKFEIYGLVSKFVNFFVEIDNCYIYKIICNEKKEQKNLLLFISPELKYENHSVSISWDCEKLKIQKLVYWPTLKAKKIEWNDLTKSGTWIDEKTTEGEVRYKTTENGGKLTIKPGINRFWLYGISHNGSNIITFVKGNFSQKILTQPLKKDDDFLVYESPIMNNTDEPLIILISGKFTFCYLYCEYQLNDAFNSSSNAIHINSEKKSFSKNEEFKSSHHPINEDNTRSKKSISSNNGKTNKCQNQIFIQNCKFFKMSSIKKEKNNAFYISTKDDEVEEIIENNYFESCGDSGYVYTIESKFATMRNNTFDFTKTESSCGAFSIKHNGNITIIDCRFIRMNKSGIINYNPSNEGKEGDFLLISECSFQECNGLCCNINVKTNSQEKIEISNCKFEKCQKGSDKSIAIFTSETSDSIKLLILNNNFTECGKDIENNYIINLQINRPNKNEEYIIFEENIFYDSCGSIQIKQQEGHAIIRKCNFEKLKQNSILVDLLANILIEDCIFDNCNCCFSIEKSILNVNIENCNFSNCYNNFGNGGAISIDNSTDNKIEFFFNNCLFLNNTSFDYGGALSLQSYQSVILINCLFIKNKASNGGGSIFIFVGQDANTDMSNFTISNCSFISNIDFSSRSHAIFFRQNPNSQSLFIIDQNCLFKDNGDLIENTFKGYSIVSESHYFEFKDSKIEFTDKHHSTSALLLNNSESSMLMNIVFKHISSGANSELSDDFNSHSMYISSTTKNVEINECLFDNCGTSSTKNAIFDNGEFTIINNCNFFNAENDTFTGGAITINSIGTHTITNCCITNGMSEFGLFIYHPQNESENDCVFTFINNTIDGFQGDSNNDKIALNFNFNQFDQLSIENVTIKNIIFSKIGIICINLSDNMTDFSVNNFQFINNKITNNTINETDIWIQNFAEKSSDLEYEFTFNKCKWINNSCQTVFGGEMGLWLFNNKKQINFLFNNCLYDSNFNMKSGGGFQDGSSKTIFKKSLHFSSCVFNNNEAIDEGGGLIIKTVLPFKIDGCKFNDNKAKSGGAIYIETTYNASSKKILSAEYGSITNCEFNSNIAEAGIIFYIYNSLYTRLEFDGTYNVTNSGESGSMIYSGCGELILSNAVFDFKPKKYEKADFLAVFINEGNNSVIENCTFIKVSNEEIDLARAIYIDDLDKITIDRCIFTDCGENNKEFVICSMESEIEFLSSVINYTNNQFSAGGINTYGVSIFMVINSTFQNCHEEKEQESGCINYNHYRLMMFGEFPVSIIGCIFDNTISKRGRAMNLNIMKEVSISNCTFKNMPNGNYILYIFGADNTINKIVLDNCIFIDNKAECDNYQGDDTGGGGAGIYLSKVNTLLLQDCHFIRNSNMKRNSNGGVLGYCTASSLNCVVCLEFVKCYFEDNMVQDGCNGSALYINSRYKPVLIDSCTFVNKKANNANYGGAIYIDGKTDKNITITNCNFLQLKLTSINKYSGNAIYIGYEVRNVHIIGCNFINCGGTGSVISFNGNPKSRKFETNLHIEACSFEENDSISGSILYFHGEVNYLTINRCVFDGLIGTEDGCLFLSIYTNTFIFNNNILKNMVSESPSNYIMKINHNNRIQSFVISNVTFINNTCSSLYGGGIGSIFEGITELVFLECTFISNKAIQDKTESRPIEGSTHHYYNGDGGGIHIGYLCSDIYISVTFDSCVFKENKSKRHGGAIAIQTMSTIKIINCTFIRNIANYQSDLLYDDHFYAYQEGKGGSIYINPSFKTEPLNCESPTKLLTSSILIEKCTFESNEGFNATSIYLAGEDHGTKISIAKNNFINDIKFGDSNKSIILTEICVISTKQIIDENNFSNTEIELQEVNILSTNCKYFSSDQFTITSYIQLHSKSQFFSETKQFSDYNEFSNSFEFTISGKFTESLHFLMTSEFSINDLDKQAISLEQLIGIICGIVAVVLFIIVIIIIKKIRHNESKEINNLRIDIENSSLSSLSKSAQRTLGMSLINHDVNNNIGSNPDDYFEILI